jgi:hypothetical protein
LPDFRAFIFHESCLVKHVIIYLLYLITKPTQYSGLIHWHQYDYH